MSTANQTRALVVVESYWGNTAAVANTAADGLRNAAVETTVVAAADAPPAIGAETTLLLIGAPTHNMSLPNPASRRIAASRGVEAGRSGVLEWLGELRLEGDPAIYAFDTHTSRFSGSAARTIVKLLGRRRISAEVGERFVVAGEPPALASGELQRAANWADQLSRLPRHRE